MLLLNKVFCTSTVEPWAEKADLGLSFKSPSHQLAFIEKGNVTLTLYFRTLNLRLIHYLYLFIFIDLQTRRAEPSRTIRLTLLPCPQPCSTQDSLF